MQDFDGPDITEGRYYAVEYHKLYNSGRALKSQDDLRIHFKFLHSTAARVFDWPMHDNINSCHKSCVFYGPAAIVSSSLFMFPKLKEVEQVYQHLR